MSREAVWRCSACGWTRNKMRAEPPTAHRSARYRSPNLCACGNNQWELSTDDGATIHTASGWRVALGATAVIVLMGVGVATIVERVISLLK